jgi:hypothetical protein
MYTRRRCKSYYHEESFPWKFVSLEGDASVDTFEVGNVFLESVVVWVFVRSVVGDVSVGLGCGRHSSGNGAIRDE